MSIPHTTHPVFSEAPVALAVCVLHQLGSLSRPHWSRPAASPGLSQVNSPVPEAFSIHISLCNGKKKKKKVILFTFW